MNVPARPWVFTLVLGAYLSCWLGRASIPFAASPNLPMWELDALQDIYTYTLGYDWTYNPGQPGNKWNFTNANPCADHWQGVICSANSTNGYLHTEQLLVSNFGLNGPLPESIGNLTNLLELSISTNPIYGTIPSNIGTLARLQYLDLGTTDMTGNIPASFANLSLLMEFYLENSLLTGSLPEAFCACSMLSVLDFQGTEFSGTLPACYGNLTELTLLRLIGAPLRGSIPASYGNLASLSVLSLTSCHLTGSLPASFAALHNLTKLALSTNLLHGAFPDGLFANMTRLNLLDLSYNAFSGPLPASPGLLPVLQVIYLQNNSLSGTLSETFTQLPQIQTISLVFNRLTGRLRVNCAVHTLLYSLDVGFNKLTGSLPTGLEQCHFLTEFYANNNLFTGTLPGGLFGAPQLLELDLASNLLSGTLPAALGALTTLEKLSFGYNAFSGTMPSVFSAMPNLKLLLLSDNALSGTVPIDVFALHELFSFDLADNLLSGSLPVITSSASLTLFNILLGGNQLTGSLPASFADLPKLIFFNASFNYLTGPLPVSVVNHWGLIGFLFLSQNALTGTVPNSWKSTSTLTFLSLDSNHFTGALPASLANATQLQSVNISSNLLSGSIPALFSRMTSLEVLLLQQNRLTGSLAPGFNASAQHSLTTIQLSNNQLTGALPEEIFRLPSMSVFAAVSNCFTGSLPQSLCESTTLVALALDGFHAASSCQNKLSFDPSVYTINQPLTGGMPTCLLQIPSLQTLHLSGNGLSGSLPIEATVISPALQDLSLSHNRLSGTIPASFLHRRWSKLDLSYNRFTGTLNDADSAPYAPNTTLYLNQNRLSGNLPSAADSLASVSLLQGNIFTCRSDRSDLPQHDNSRERYECGSDAVNTALYVWLVLGVTAVVVAGVSLYVRSATYQEIIASLKAWWVVGGANQSSTLPSVQALDDVSWATCTLALCCGAYVFIVLTPVYVTLSVIYGTYTYQYAWVLAGSFLSGTDAFTAMFVFLMLLLAGCYASTVRLLKPLVDGDIIPKVGKNLEEAATAPEAHAASSKGFRRYLWYALYLAVNFVIVVGVNIAFVVASLSESGHALAFIQIALAVFKVAFNSLAAPYLKRMIQSQISQPETFIAASSASAEFAALQLFVALCNNIVIPCLVVAAISPSCFYNVFHAASDVTSQYTYEGMCTAIGLFDGNIAICSGQQLTTDTTSYSPPFAYSYQCSSSFVTYYAPPFVSMCIIAMFVVPLLQVTTTILLQRARPGSQWYGLLRSATPRLLRPIPAADAVTTSAGPNGFGNCLDLTQHTITLLTYLGLLLTFGALFPPLAVCFVGAMVSVHTWNRLRIGRFLHIAALEGREDCTTAVERVAGRVAGVGFARGAVWGMIALSGAFYTLFLFDTLGDAVGLQKAYWVLIVTPMLPLCGLFLHWGVRGRKGVLTPSLNAARTVENVELGIVPSKAWEETVGSGVSPLHQE